MTRTPEKIAAEIAAWNLRDVTELRDLIAELAECRDSNYYPIDTQAFIDMSALPSAEIPADIDTSYPVWAIDLDGNALVGDSADEIQTLDEVRA